MMITLYEHQRTLKMFNDKYIVLMDAIQTCFSKDNKFILFFFLFVYARM